MFWCAGIALAQPVLINTTLPDAVYGVPYSANIMVGGTPMPTSVVVTGLPTGITATHNGSGSVAFSGSATQTGVFPLTVTATNSGGTITPSISLTVARYSAAVSTVAAGNGHSCAVVSGGVQCWGNNSYGQLGNGSTTMSTTPVQVTGLTSGVTAVATGDFHSCAVVSGGVRCWGNNGSGQLGNGSTTQSTTPVQVTGLISGVTAVATGNSHSCAVVSGGVRCWGWDFFGQLGNGSGGDSTTPAQVTGLTSGVTAVATSVLHSCAVVSGGVRCWGYNGFAQLGNGSTTDSATPVQVTGLTSGVTAVATGGYNSCAVVSGGVQCWGNNGSGQLGNGSTTQRSTPVQVTGLTSGVTAATTGGSHSCAVVNGGVQCWGDNGIGQLGNGSTAQSTTPVQSIASGANVASVATGGAHTCALVNGAAQCWGYNFYGQLGNGTTTGAPAPVQVTGLASGVTALAAGGYFSCAVVSGGVKCWGYNANGQLGNGSTTDSTTPVQVTGLTSGVTAVAPGGGHACAVVSGGVKCWGNNGSGQLGNGSTTNSTTPVQVTGLTSGVTAVATGNNHSCAVFSGGVMCWGQNFYGQLGTGSTTNSATPVQVTGLTSGVTAVAAGDIHSCAAVSGAVKCWGNNGSGQLGNGSTSQSTTPVQATGLTSGFTAVATGNNHSCALVSGGVKCWGNNGSGQLGNGSTTSSTTAVQPLAAGSGAATVAAGGSHSCAVVNAGLQCWGNNGTGQLADLWTAPGRQIYAAIPYVSYTLTSISNGSGAGAVTSSPAGISCGATCSASFEAGTVVTLTATPSIGSSFSAWSGGGCSGTGTCVVTLTAATNVSATFTINQYTVTSTGSGTGGSISPPSQTVNHGSTTTFSVVPTSGFTPSASGCDGSLVGTTFTTGTITGPCAVTAVFTLNQYTLTYTANPNGSISGATPQTINYGSNGSAVTAVADTGYHFTQWSDASTANPRSDSNVTANLSVAASFAINQYTVSSTGSGGGGSISPASQTVNHGSTTTFSVVPTAGYTASANGCSGSLVGTMYTTGSITAACTVTAVFTLNQYTLTYTANTNGSISGATPQTVNHGGSGSAVTAVPNGGYYFTQWSDASTANPRTDSSVTANITVAASFAAKGVTGISINDVSPTSSVYGEAVDVTALVTGGINPTGIVTIVATPDLGGTPQQCSNTLSAGAATCTLPALGEPGAYTLVAAYAGDVNDAASSSAAVAHQVTTIPTAVTIVSHTPDPSLIGSAFTVNVDVAAVSPPAGVGVPGGSFTVSASGTESCAIASLSAGASSSTGSCALTLTSAGLRTLTVNYAGDAHFAANSNTTAHTVNLAATTTTVSGVVPGPSSTFGQTITVGATVGGGIDPTGTVTITASPSGVTCTAALSAGSASCALNPGNAGSYTLSATYNGDGNDAGSTSSGVGHTVNSAANVINFPSVTLPFVWNSGSRTLAASASSLLPVSYSLVVTGPCVLTGSTLTPNSSGSCTVRASQAGNSNYVTATAVDQVISISKATQTISFLPVLSSPIIYSPTGSFALGATASSGLTTFSYASSGSPGICSVSGNTVTVLTAGVCSLTATQVGDGQWESASANATVTIYKADQLIVFGSAPVIAVGGSGNVSATGGGATSPVMFNSQTGAVCSVHATSGLVMGLTAGSCIIAANQSGDADKYNAAAQVTQNFSIGKAAPTLALSGNGSSGFGNSVTFTATLSGTGAAPTGTVGFSADGNAVVGCGAQAVSSNIATCSNSTLSGGVHSITAAYTGDDNNQAAAAAAVSHTVTQAVQTLSFAAQSPTFRALVVGGSFLINPLAVAGASSGAVAYSVAPSGVCTLVDTTVTMVGLGSCAITASQVGDGNYEDAAPVTQSVAIVATLDVDNSVSESQYHALTDGLLIVRYLAGASGDALTLSALGATAARTDAADIKTYLDAIRPLLDVDGDGVVNANTDGILILRYLLELRGAALIADVTASAVLAADVEARVQALMP